MWYNLVSNKLKSALYVVMQVKLISEKKMYNIFT